MHILITARVEDDDADFGDSTGLTDDARARVMAALIAAGLDDVSIDARPVDD